MSPACLMCLRSYEIASPIYFIGSFLAQKLMIFSLIASLLTCPSLRHMTFHPAGGKMSPHFLFSDRVHSVTEPLLFCRPQ